MNKRTDGLDIVIWIVMIGSIVVTMYPVLLIVAGSFSGQEAFLRGEVGIIPVDFTLNNYKKVFAMGEIWSSYWNSIKYTVLSTVVSLICTCGMAYALSKRHLVGRKFFTYMLMFTMMFSGGMIPTFLIISKLGMVNTIWAIVLPGAVSAWYVILARTFFEGIPDSLEESAKIDGANDVIVFAKIYLPLSMPIVATLALYFAVGQWNNFMGPLIYMNETKDYPLALLLRQWLVSDIGNQSDPSALSNTVRNYTAIVVSTLPILCVYPFVQRYFTQGMMVGAIKG